MHLFRVAAMLVAAMLLLAGCAGRPQIPFGQSATAPVKTIGLLTPGIPPTPEVVLASSVGRSFGLLGHLVDSAMQANRDSQFTALLARQGFSAQNAFSASLTETLQAQGYTVVPVPTARPQPAEFLKSYPTAAQPPVDAYLDLASDGYGYVAAGISGSTPYRPRFGVAAKLVSARDSTVLMQDSIIYNPIGAAGQVTTIPPDPAYQFSDFDALIANPTQAVKGLESAIQQTAATLGKLLQ